MAAIPNSSRLDDGASISTQRKVVKLQQNQVWQQGEIYFRIVRLDRLSVEFKEMKSPDTKNGTHHTSSKKEFCRIIKGATLLAD